MLLPWDDVPEGYCTACEGFTTNYDDRGECREHGVAVTADMPAKVVLGPNCCEYYKTHAPHEVAMNGEMPIVFCAECAKNLPKF